jgi:hypothetical protein
MSELFHRLEEAQSRDGYRGYHSDLFFERFKINPYIDFSKSRDYGNSVTIQQA